MVLFEGTLESSAWQQACHLGRGFIYIFFHHKGPLSCNTYLFVLAVQLSFSAAKRASVREWLRIAGPPVLTAFPNQDLGTRRLLHFGGRSEKEQEPHR